MEPLSSFHFRSVLEYALKRGWDGAEFSSLTIRKISRDFPLRPSRFPEAGCGSCWRNGGGKPSECYVTATDEFFCAHV